MKQVIYLSGSSGMVGKNILDHAESKNYRILAPTKSELNLLKYTDVETFIAKNKPDLIIHAAGVVGGIEANIKQPVKKVRKLSENLYLIKYQAHIDTNNKIIKVLTITILSVFIMGI